MSPPLVDTSVVVRYLVASPEDVAGRAREILEGEDSLVLSELVLVESAYVLRSVYGVDRERVVDALAELIQRHNLRLLHLAKPLALEALDLCRPSGRTSFADALLWAQARQVGAEAVFTFDQRFPQHEMRTRA